MNYLSATEMRVTVLLSLQAALLGMVTPSLRGVAVSWTEQLVRARFIYEVEDSRHEELVQEIETLVLSDFVDTDTYFTIESLGGSTPVKLEQDEVAVYLRFES